MPIKILPPALANQIAAGEVIERPASVVKELVENAIDAKADTIKIQLQKGGIGRICVIDNGIGLSQADLKLAVEAHATSKITQSSDLFNIQTLGFRGEALSSISAVSRLSITSKTKADEHGWIWRNEDIKPIACSEGTEVQLDDLFFNVPARKKFLRAESTEYRHCLNTIHRLVLANPHCAFVVEHNGKQVFRCEQSSDTTSQLARIRQVLGKDFCEAAVEIKFKQGDFSLHGFVAKPVFSRAQNDMQYWYVNQRMVKDKLLSGAVRRAYRDMMYHDRQPAYVLYFDLPASEVDVNVHPAKHEVRFRQTGAFDFIRQAVHHTISRPIKEQDEANKNNPPVVSRDLPVQSQQLVFQRPTGHSSPRSPAANSSRLESYIPFANEPEPRAQTVDLASMNAPLGEALAFVHGAFILSTTELGICVVDAHGAHERILYEKLKAAYQNNNLSAQTLLVPISLSLSSDERELLNSHNDHFTALKFIIEPASDNAAIIRQIPSLLLNMDIKQLVHDTLSDLLQESDSHRMRQNIEALLSTIACHSAVRANRMMNLNEMNALLRQLENVESGEVCNHGRPIIQHFPVAEMDAWFKRGK